MQRQLRYVHLRQVNYEMFINKLKIKLTGFDYIRKKKKPTHNSAEKCRSLSTSNIIKRRLAAMESLETKDENDICKEIKGWVLNKGVGESVLHKASRLDYVVSKKYLNHNNLLRNIFF